MEFRKTFRVELDDYISFNLFHLRIRLIVNIIVFTLLLPTIMLIVNRSQDYLFLLLASLIFGILISGFMTVINIFSIKRQSKKQYDSTKVMQADNLILIDKSGIQESNEYSQTRISWTDVFKATESKNGFYIYFSKMQAFVIPKRLVSPEEEKILRGLIDVNLPTKKNRLKTDNINVAI